MIFDDFGGNLYDTIFVIYVDVSFGRDDLTHTGEIRCTDGIYTSRTRKAVGGLGLDEVMAMSSIIRGRVYSI